MVQKGAGSLAARHMPDGGRGRPSVHRFGEVGRRRTWAWETFGPPFRRGRETCAERGALNLVDPGTLETCPTSYPPRLASQTVNPMIEKQIPKATTKPITSTGLGFWISSPKSGSSRRSSNRAGAR